MKTYLSMKREKMYTNYATACNTCSKKVLQKKNQQTAHEFDYFCTTCWMSMATIIFQG